MRTLVVSDLHLGARTGVDVLRRPAALDALAQRLEGAERLVLLGDTLELRHGPVRDVLAAARPVLERLGDVLGDAEVVLVPGNHDHHLVAGWLERRGHHGPPPVLGLEERAGPGASPATQALAEMLAPARLDVAYPGLWLAGGVYATHGHYLDHHVTIPSFERLAAGTLARVLGAPAAQARGPDDYELVLAPLYALLDAVAARTDGQRGAARATASASAWATLSSSGRRPWRSSLLAAAFPLGIGALNRAGVGPLKRDLSGQELRRAALAAMRRVVDVLGVRARHVLFGHTHRAGPLAGDDPSEWALPGGGRLMNTGCWVYEDVYLRRGRGSPYWPGGAVELSAGGEPRHLRLLEGVGAAALAP